jgi:hypothetical protein
MEAQSDISTLETPQPEKREHSQEETGELKSGKAAPETDSTGAKYLLQNMNVTAVGRLSGTALNSESVPVGFPFMRTLDERATYPYQFPFITPPLVSRPSNSSPSGFNNIIFPPILTMGANTTKLTLSPSPLSSPSTSPVKNPPGSSFS